MGTLLSKVFSGQEAEEMTPLCASNFSFDVRCLIKVKHLPIYPEYIIYQPSIGSGSYGEVFKACHINTKLTRSVKKVNIIKSSGALKEYQILRQLDHPNILKLYEVFVQGNYYSLVTDFYQGGSLRNKINEHQRLSESTCAKYLEQIVQGVSYMHKKGFMHCDIKPDNVLLEENERLVKIIDFGISRKISEFRCKPQEIGTQQFNAPEVLEGVVLPASDIWACGVTLITMLIGKTPSTHKLLNGKFEFDIDFARLLSEEAKDLIEKMTKVEPSERITASDALKHPWFQLRSSQKGIDLGSIEKYLSNIKYYLRYNRLQCLFVSMIANYVLDQHHRLSPTEVFIQCDRDSDGIISINELRQMILKTCPDTYKIQNLEAIFREIDKNQSREIDLREFLACSIDPNIVLEPTYIKQIFGEIDANKDDRITMSEFKNYVSVVVPDHGIQDELFEKMDTHGTGEITLEDFTLVLRNKLQPKFEDAEKA